MGTAEGRLAAEGVPTGTPPELDAMLANPIADADTEIGAADELASELSATGAVADSEPAQPLTSNATTQPSARSGLRTLAPPERLTPQDDVRLHAGQQGDEP